MRHGVAGSCFNGKKKKKKEAQNNCAPAPQHQTNKHTEHYGWRTFHQLKSCISAAVRKVDTNASFATLHKFAISTLKSYHIILQLSRSPRVTNKSVTAGLNKGLGCVAQTLYSYIALCFFSTFIRHICWSNGSTTELSKKNCRIVFWGGAGGKTYCFSKLI